LGLLQVGADAFDEGVARILVLRIAGLRHHCCQSAAPKSSDSARRNCSIASALILYVASNAAGAPNPIASGLGANGYGEHSPGLYSMGAAMLIEIVLTMFLVLTVLGSTDLKAPVGFAGLAIGLVLTLIHLVGIPITNTSVNPARSIGPAIFVGGWALQQLWLFIVAPLAGATLAAVVYGAMRIPGETITPREAERR
jgi:aquaporin Z